MKVKLLFVIVVALDDKPYSCATAKSRWLLCIQEREKEREEGGGGGEREGERDNGMTTLSHFGCITSVHVHDECTLYM